MPRSALSRTYRHVQRLREILTVFARHGFGHLFHSSPFRQLLPFRLGLRAREGDPEPNTGRRIAAACQELGTTFVKMGQQLSQRSDLLGDELIHELRQLQDRVEPFSWTEAQAALAAALGAPPGERFAEIESTPMAAGSIAQVYRARTKSGQPVIVKVRRPGIEENIRTDLGLMRTLAEALQRYSADLRAVNLTALVEEFSEALLRELDFSTEAAATARFHRLFSGRGVLSTPRVFWELTNESVLTLEYLEGRSLREALETGLPEPERHRLADRLISSFTDQYFRAGFFHADPHPGNLLLMSDGSLGLVDFGSVGGLAAERQWQLVLLLASLPERDVDLMVETFAEMNVLPPGTRREQLKSDLLHLLQKYEDTPLKQVNARTIYGEITTLLRKHRVVLPRELLLLAKSLAAVVSLAKELHPTLNLGREVSAATRNLVREQVAFRPLVKSTGLGLIHLFRLLAAMPRDIMSIVRRVRDGQAEIAFRHRGLDNFINELEQSSNRLTIAIVAAALIIGSSLLIFSKNDIMLVGQIPVAVVGLFGYLVAGVLGIYLLVAIIRSGRF